jgi:hypothetical protein
MKQMAKSATQNMKSSVITPIEQNLYKNLSKTTITEATAFKSYIQVY